ncbi:MAG: hypothetical protein K5750_06870 [Eubacterium sp.]|nr:hypothetical protein [Eubacterium sp.]
MNTKEQEIEVNLISLLFYVVKHWRSVVLTSCIFALIFVPFSIYRESHKKAESGTVAQTEENVSGGTETTVAETSGNDLLTNNDILSPAEKDCVNNCFSQILVYYDKYCHCMESPYMEIDGNNAPVATLLLNISGSDETDISGISGAYSSLLDGISFHQYAAGEGIDIKIWDNLIFIYPKSNKENTSCLMTINVYYPDKETCEMLLNTIIEYISDSQKSISEAYGNHEIKIISRSTDNIYSDCIIDCQNTTKNGLSQNYSSIIQQINAFSKAQLGYLYELMIPEYSEDNEIIQIVSDLTNSFGDQDEKNMESVKTLQAEGDIGKTLVEEEKTSNEGGSVSFGSYKEILKKVLCGLFIGLFFSCFFHAFVFMISNRLDYADDLTYLFGIPQLGNVIRDSSSKNPIDKMIFRLQHLGRKHDEKADIAICAEDIRYSIQKEQVEHAALITCRSEFEGLDILKCFTDEMTGLGENAAILQNVLEKSENFAVINKIDGAVVIGMSGITPRNDIYRLVDILKRHNIKLVGGVIIE